MLFNYLKIALRNIRKEKTYAIINILGLATGMAATLLILLYVQDELSYDDYHENSDRIYRVSREWLNGEGESTLHLGHCAPPFAPLLENDFEGIIDEAVRITDGGQPLISHEETRIEEPGFYFGDEDVFSVFSWPLVSGDPDKALTEPAQVVITESAAVRYFGNDDPLGQQIVFNNFGMSFPMTITGVAKDVPHNSHFSWDFMASFASIEQVFGRENMMQNWGSNNYGTYVLLAPNAELKSLEAEIPDFLDRHLPSNPQASTMPSEYNRLHLMPVTDIHLHSHLDSEMAPNNDIAYIYVYTIIAVFILMIACINFVNLSTAKSARRAKEVGLRKVMGAYRKSLVGQFLTESVVFAIISLLIASLIVTFALPYFNQFINTGIRFSLVGNQFIVLMLIGMVVFVGLLAGSYPAFYLSRFQPATILKSGHKATGRKFNFRSVLVVFQFLISISLIISVGIVHDQLDYVRSRSLGFNKENVMVLPSSNEIYAQFGNLKQRFEQQPGITEVSLASRVPSGRLLDSQGTTAEIDGEMKQLSIRVADIHVDHDYFNSLEISIIAGRDFDPAIISDSTNAFIVNEAAVNRIGWTSPQDAVGKRFDYGGRSGEIIGVVNDFHFESLHQTIAPIVFMITNGRANNVLVRYDPDQKAEVEAYLQEQWSYLRPDFPFSFFEIDNQFSEQYSNEDRLASVVTWFSILAVIIAALGLFGLASFIAEQRIKEIGIRKVMGASVSQILLLLTRGFTLLVLVALLIAGPLAYFGMRLWLKNFAYYGDIQAGPFLIAGGIALLIAWLTISYQTLRAALSNPIETLRYE